jgi:hypothetical protein
MENIEVSNQTINVRNLVVFPTVEAKFSDTKINVENYLVILGSLDANRCKIKTKTLLNGYQGSLRDLQKMIGFTGDEVVELVERLNQDKTNQK